MFSICFKPNYMFLSVYFSGVQQNMGLPSVIPVSAGNALYFYSSCMFLNLLQMFINITQDRLKLNNLLYQKHVQTQVLKW